MDCNPLDTLQRFQPADLGRFANRAAIYAAAEAVAELGYGAPPDPDGAPLLLGGTPSEAAEAEVVMLVGVVLRLTERIRTHLARRPDDPDTAAASATLYRIDAALTAVAEAACRPHRVADGAPTPGETASIRRGRHLALVGANQP